MLQRQGLRDRAFAFRFFLFSLLCIAFVLARNVNQHLQMFLKDTFLGIIIRMALPFVRAVFIYARISLVMACWVGVDAWSAVGKGLSGRF